MLALELQAIRAELKKVTIAYLTRPADWAPMLKITIDVSVTVIAGQNAHARSAETIAKALG